mgnify:FL=1
MSEMAKMRYPRIPDADNSLRDIVTHRAEELYGIPLPDEIAERIEWELQAVENVGTASIYLLLKKAVECVRLQPEEMIVENAAGNSFLLYLCGIGDVNPVEYGMPPERTYGVKQDKPLSINLEVPVELQDSIIMRLGQSEGVGAAIHPGVSAVVPGNVALPFGCARRIIREQIPGDEMGNGTPPWCDVLSEGIDNSGIQKEIECLNQDRVLLIPEGEKITIQTPFSQEYFSLGVIGRGYLQSTYDLYREKHINPAEISFQDPEILQAFMDPERMQQALSYSFLPVPAIEVIQEAFKWTKPDSFYELMRLIALIVNPRVWKTYTEPQLKSGADLQDLIAFLEELAVRPEQSAEHVRFLFPQSHILAQGRNAWRWMYFEAYPNK